MDGRIIASSRKCLVTCIPNPDQQVWEMLIPSSPETDTSKYKKDYIEEMIEAGED